MSNKRLRYIVKVTACHKKNQPLQDTAAWKCYKFNGGTVCFINHSDQKSNKLGFSIQKHRPHFFLCAGGEQVFRAFWERRGVKDIWCSGLTPSPCGLLCIVTKCHHPGDPKESIQDNPGCNLIEYSEPLTRPLSIMQRLWSGKTEPRWWAQGSCSFITLFHNAIPADTGTQTTSDAEWQEDCIKYVMGMHTLTHVQPERLPVLGTQYVWENFMGQFWMLAHGRKHCLPLRGLCVCCLSNVTPHVHFWSRGWVQSLCFLKGLSIGFVVVVCVCVENVRSYNKYFLES